MLFKSPNSRRRREKIDIVFFAVWNSLEHLSSRESQTKNNITAGRPGMPRRSENVGAIDSGDSDLYRQLLNLIRTSHCGLPSVNGSRQIWSGLAEAGTGRYYAVPMVLDTPQYP